MCPAPLDGRAPAAYHPLVKLYQVGPANLDVGGAYEWWPGADGVTAGAMKPGVSTAARLSVDHIAVRMSVEPPEIVRVVVGLEDGHEPSSPKHQTGYQPASGGRSDVAGRGAARPHGGRSPV